MPALSYIKSFLLLIILLPGIAFGQASLRGTVTDAANKETLIGVNVIVLGTSLGAATDIEGQYWIVGIPTRVFSVKFSYIGYEAQVKEIDFSKIKDATIDVQLSPAIIEGEEVVVTAQMRGQLAAINQQITSNRIVNVVSEEKIKELPDVNAAEAIGRLPGVALIRSGGEATQVVLRGLSSKFSNLTLDGVKIPATDPNTRDVDLSMISQGSLAGIELYKTLTPDQDADAIAGGINMVTRKAPSERLVNLDLKGGYNHLMKSTRQYDIQGRYGERFFDDLLGVQLQANVEKKIRSKEDYNFGYDAGIDNPNLPNYNSYDHLQYGNDYVMNAFTVRFTDETRKRTGVQAIFDYNTPDSGSIKLSGMYNQTSRDIMMHERIYLSLWKYNYEHIEQVTNTKNGSLRGKNYLLGMTIDWNASFAESQISNPHNYRMTFAEAAGGTLQGPVKDHPEKNIIPFANNRFEAALLDSAFRYRIENYEKEQTFLLNLTKSFTISRGISDEIKIGGKIKSKSRWLDNYGYAWNYYQVVPILDKNGSPIDFSGTPFEGTSSHASLTRFLYRNNVESRDLLGLYRMTPIVDFDMFKMWEEMTQNAKFTANINYGVLGMSPLNNYSMTERITSAFFMNTMDIGQNITLIFGVRAEREVNDYRGYYNNLGVAGTGAVLVLDPAYVRDTTANYSETFLLPNVQINFKPTDFLTLRLASYKALARPDYNMRLPQFSYSKAAAGTNIVVGNPRIKNATAWNYEANAQVYSNTIGLISVSGFYKVIDNLYARMNNVPISWSGNQNLPMGYYVRVPNSQVGYYRFDQFIEQVGGMSEWKKTPEFNNILHDDLSYTLTTGYNSPKPTYVWGAEFEHQINFSFLPVSWLKNFTLSYNISVTRSQTYIWSSKSVIDTQFVPESWLIVNGIPIMKLADSTYNLIGNSVPQLVKRSSEGQPELYGNAALGYDIGGLSVRISVFYQDKYVRQNSPDGASDQVVDELIKWDLSLKQRVTPYISLLLNINNIFNRQETTSRYNNIFDWGYLPSRGELYGTTIDFGVRVSL